MKKLNKLEEYTGFQYRGTAASRRRMREMDFCRSVGVDSGSCIWITDKSGDRFYADAWDWIVVTSNSIDDVLDSDAFSAAYEVVSEA